MKKTTKTSSHIFIGFDFGLKRIGVAIGQTINKWLPDALIVGIPLHMDGTDQTISHHARQFAKSLHKRYQLPVYETDERLTTKDARERLFAQGGYQALQDGQVDRVAAQLILQNWLAAKSDKNN